MTLREEDAGESKYEERSTMYEVNQLGTTRLRGRRSRKAAWVITQGSREIDTPEVCETRENCIDRGIAAVSIDFLRTGLTLQARFSSNENMSMYGGRYRADNNSEGIRILNTCVKSFLNFFCLFFKGVGDNFFPRKAKFDYPFFLLIV